MSEEFVFVGPLWFVCQPQHVKSGDGGKSLCESLVKANVGEHECVVAFTDGDLARRFIERIDQSRVGQKPSGLNPFTAKSMAEFLATLRLLERLNYSRVVIDWQPGSRVLMTSPTALHKSAEKHDGEGSGDSVP